MNSDPNQSGFTRHNTVALIAVVVFALGLVALLAQDFRIKQVKLDSPNRVIINYDAEAGASYTLLQGNSVTTINTPVATNTGAAGSAFFAQSISPTNREKFFRIAATWPITTSGFQAFSREISVFNCGAPTANLEAISKEVGVYNGEAPPRSSFQQVYSREESVFNFGNFP